jgi:hypothetical protein
MDARPLIALAAAAVLVLPAAATARTNVDHVRVSERAGGGATVTVRGRWDAALLRRDARQIGAVRIGVRRGADVGAARTWRRELRGTRSARFTHRFRLTRAEARGLWRGTRTATAAAATDAADLAVHVSHLVDADADGVFEAGSLSAGGPNCDSFAPEADLSGCNLNSAYLAGVNLAGANLERTELSGAVLKGANLAFVTAAFTIMAGTDVSGAEVGGAEFIGALLIDTNFTGSDLMNASFPATRLNGSILTGATLTGTQCRNTIWVDGSTVPGPDCPGA